MLYVCYYFFGYLFVHNQFNLQLIPQYSTFHTRICTLRKVHIQGVQHTHFPNKQFGISALLESQHFNTLSGVVTHCHLQLDKTEHESSSSHCESLCVWGTAGQTPAHVQQQVVFPKFGSVPSDNVAFTQVSHFVLCDQICGNLAFHVQHTSRTRVQKKRCAAAVFLKPAVILQR